MSRGARAQWSVNQGSQESRIFGNLWNRNLSFLLLQAIGYVFYAKLTLNFIELILLYSLLEGIPPSQSYAVKDLTNLINEIVPCPNMELFFQLVCILEVS